MNKVKRFFVLFMVFCVILGVMSNGVHAQTSVSSLLEMIKQLQAQVQELQAKLEAVRKAQEEAGVAAQNVENTFQLVRTLRQGMSGDDVKALQAVLAADTSIYPEAMITGYFGTITARAVMRFQRKHGFEQVGFVGPLTRQRLNDFLRVNLVSVEDDNDDGDEDRDHDRKDRDDTKDKRDKKEKKVCVAVPPGHLIAPGWLKKHKDSHNGDSDLVPLCRKLPPGIWKKLPPFSSSTPDTTAPVISAVAVNGISGTAATVSWVTDEKATSRVYFSTPSPVVLQSARKVQDHDFVTNHSLHLSGLTASTTYSYFVVSTDKFGNVATSTESMFVTSGSLSDTSAPVITSLMSSNISSSSATISWTTNEPATSKVLYSTSSPVTATSSMVSNSSLVTGHSMMLSGLQASTTYYYIAVSADGSGNTATSTEGALTTSMFTPDTVAPIISSLASSNISSSSATISWTTNEPATSKVLYSTSSPVSLTSLEISSSSLKVSHSLTFYGLQASTTYYYVAVSRDGSGNEATSTENMFITQSPPDVTPPVVSGVSALDVSSSSAVISWTTNEPATSNVYYSTSTPVVIASAFSIASSSFVTSHSLFLPGLMASTTYYYIAGSQDVAFNTATSSEFAFLTLP